LSIFKRLENSDVFALPWKCWVFLFTNCLFNFGRKSIFLKANEEKIPVLLKSEPKKSKQFSLFSWLQHASIICQTNTVVFNFCLFRLQLFRKWKHLVHFTCVFCTKNALTFSPPWDLGDFANFQHKTKNISPICFFSNECRCRHAAVVSWGTECCQTLSMTNSRTSFRKFKNVLPWFGGEKERNLD